VSRSALIVGLGLIGGSAGIALRRRGWRVRYIDPGVTPEEALSAGAASSRADSPAGDDVLILAVPVDVAIQLLPQLREASLVTSVCSVMEPLRRVSSGVEFVSGHPMAGSEQRGLGAARGEMFEGKTWFVDRAHPLIEELIRDCGAVMTVVDPARHDAAVAVTSHLPQILSTALAASIDPETAPFAGSGLETFLRLAASDASVWRPIIAANRGNIEAALDGLLQTVRAMLDGDEAAFADAQQTLEELRKPRPPSTPRRLGQSLSSNLSVQV
jgi:prephenate dehydrogenase